MNFLKKLYLLLLIVVFTISFDCFASTKTFERSEEDYLVPDDIVVTYFNRAAIMSTPAVDAEEKVYDFADLFTDSEEEKLYDEIIKYINNYSMDMAVVTIDENNKYSAMEYADDFYDYNLFDYNGLLLLIDMDNREIYITTTGSAIDMYTDYRIDLILDGIYDKVSDELYYEGASVFVSISSQLADKGIPQGEENFVLSSAGKITKNLYIMQVFWFAFIGTIVIILIMVFSNRMVRKASSSREYLNKSTMKIDSISEMFLGSNVSKVRRSDSSSSSSSRGGSSTRSSSSGRSHGGGGRRF